VVVSPLGEARRTGLNYPAVHAAMAMLNISKIKTGGLFSDIQIMEAAALTVFNKAKD
jgi:hypothetical protein